MGSELRLDSFDEEQNRYRIACDTNRLNEFSLFFFSPPFTRESKGEIVFKNILIKRLTNWSAARGTSFETCPYLAHRQSVHALNELMIRQRSLMIQKAAMFLCI